MIGRIKKNMGIFCEEYWGNEHNVSGWKRLEIMDGNRQTQLDSKSHYEKHKNRKKVI